MDADTHKFLGIRLLDKLTRPLGSDGRQEMILTEPLHLLKGWKRELVTVKASQQAPRKVTSMVQMISGKLKRR